MKKRKKKRLLSLLLSLCIVLTLMPIVPLKVDAATNGHTRNEAVAWASRQTGAVNPRIAANGLQCVDLVKNYLEYLGQAANSVGPARNYGTTYQFDPTWNRYNNTQATPEPGDIVVYTYGTYGHVGIVITADSNGYTYMDFNACGGNVKNFTCPGNGTPHPNETKPCYIGGVGKLRSPIAGFSYLIRPN